jgi:response regulator of citrate/malate metabolism
MITQYQKPLPAERISKHLDISKITAKKFLLFLEGMARSAARRKEEQCIGG